MENTEINIDQVEFQDDPNVSSESEFIFSKGVLYVSLGRNVLLIVAGTYVVTTNPTSIVTYILPAIGILLSINPIIKLRKQAVPKLTLNIKGIGVDDKFYNWQHISEETAKMSGVGKNRSSYIFFNFRGEDRRIDLASYEVTLPELRHLLKVYRHRNKAVNI